MPQTLAMNARFYPVDAAGIERDAQAARLRDFQLQNAPLEAETQRMKLMDEQGKLSALRDYRADAATKGPMAALPRLNAYPEVQADIYGELDKAFGGMTPEQKMKAAERAQRFGRAAQYVDSFEDGSPDQMAAWKTSLQVLYEDGDIDEKTYQAALESGPNRMLINQAIEVADYVKQRTDIKTQNDTRLTDARIGEIDRRIERQDDEAGNRNANRDRLSTYRESRGGVTKDGKSTGGMTEYQRRMMLRNLRKDLAEARDNGDEELATQIEDEINGLSGSGSGSGVDPNITQFDLMTQPQQPAPKRLIYNPNTGELE